MTNRIWTTFRQRRLMRFVRPGSTRCAQEMCLACVQPTTGPHGQTSADGSNPAGAAKLRVSNVTGCIWDISSQARMPEDAPGRPQDAFARAPGTPGPEYRLVRPHGPYQPSAAGVEIWRSRSKVAMPLSALGVCGHRRREKAITMFSHLLFYITRLIMDKACGYLHNLGKIVPGHTVAVVFRVCRKSVWLRTRS